MTLRRQPREPQNARPRPSPPPGTRGPPSGGDGLPDSLGGREGTRAEQEPVGAEPEGSHETLDGAAAGVLALAGQQEACVGDAAPGEPVELVGGEVFGEADREGEALRERVELHASMDTVARQQLSNVPVDFFDGGPQSSRPVDFPGPDSRLLERLEWVLRNQGLSGRELAQKAGLSDAAVNVLLKRLRVDPETKPHPKTLVAISGATGISQRWLLDGSGTPTISERERAALRAAVEAGATNVASLTVEDLRGATDDDVLRVDALHLYIAREVTRIVLGEAAAQTLHAEYARKVLMRRAKP